MTPEQAILIRARMKSTAGWTDIVKHHPKFAAAIEKLPDESGIADAVVILQELYQDAKKWAEETIPSHLCKDVDDPTEELEIEFDQEPMKPKIPCGQVMGHGMYCCEDMLCSQCKRIRELEGELEEKNGQTEEVDGQVECPDCKMTIDKMWVDDNGRCTVCHERFVAMKMLTRFKELRREQPKKPMPDIGWMMDLRIIALEHEKKVVR